MRHHAILCFIFTLGLGLLTTTAQAVDPNATPADIPGTYTGSYNWLDMAPGVVGDDKLEMVITAEGDAFKVAIKANFHSKTFDKQFQEPKSYSYSGTVTVSKSDAKNPGKYRVLRGVIAAEKGKQSWDLRIKITPKGRCIGLATETEPGYDSWGVFDLQAKGSGEEKEKAEDKDKAEAEKK